MIPPPPLENPDHGLGLGGPRGTAELWAEAQAQPPGSSDSYREAVSEGCLGPCPPLCK